MPPDPDEFAPDFISRRVFPKVDQALMSGILGLRFDVYCQEFGFLPASAYPDSRETDEHDSTAAHFCALDRRHALAGYVRLVPADSGGRFPFQQHCPDLFNGTVLPKATEAGEISRLMVCQRYRRRRGDTIAGVTLSTQATPKMERRNDSPQITLSMFRQMYLHSVHSGIQYWYAAMERSLARALARLGFTFVAIGPATDYYGPVAPYVADLRELEGAVGRVNPALLRWLSGENGCVKEESNQVTAKEPCASNRIGDA